MASVTARTSRRVAAGAVVALLTGGCGLLGGRRGETPAEIAARERADEEIRARVESRLAAEPSIGPGRIRVVVSHGEAELHGSVAGMGAHQCAERTTELTPGVQLVIDFLVLERGPREVRCLAPRP